MKFQATGQDFAENMEALNDTMLWLPHSSAGCFSHFDLIVLMPLFGEWTVAKPDAVDYWIRLSVNASLKEKSSRWKGLLAGRWSFVVQPVTGT